MKEAQCQPYLEPASWGGQAVALSKSAGSAPCLLGAQEGLSALLGPHEPVQMGQPCSTAGQFGSRSGPQPRGKETVCMLTEDSVWVVRKQPWGHAASVGRTHTAGADAEHSLPWKQAP